MSGSGGGGSSSGIPTDDTRSQGERPSRPGKSDGHGGAPGDPCDVTEVTTLNSPNRTVVSNLREGEVLDVELSDGPPRLLLAKRSNHAVAGSITSAKTARQILDCMRHGKRYEAVVVEVRRGLCQIRIQPK